MKEIIASLLESYERGKVSRRQLIQGLAAIAASAHTVPAFGSTFQGVGLNHIAIRVTNVQQRVCPQRLVGVAPNDLMWRGEQRPISEH